MESLALEQKKQYENYIFDFDGTIADTVAIFVEIANELLVQYGIDQITHEDIQKLRGMTIPQAFKYVGVPYYRLPQVAVRLTQGVQKRKTEIEPHERMIEVLKELNKRGAYMGILTSNTKVTVDSFLRRNQIKNLFNFVDTGVSAFGKSTKLRGIFNKYKLDKKVSLYIGDEVRDIEAAKKLQLDITSVTWGANNEEILSKKKPTYIIRRADELLKLN